MHLGQTHTFILSTDLPGKRQSDRFSQINADSKQSVKIREISGLIFFILIYTDDEMNLALKIYSIKKYFISYRHIPL